MNMHIVKSLLVLLFLIAVTVLFCCLLINQIIAYRKAKVRMPNILLIAFVGIVALIAHLTLWEYTYPFEQELDLRLVTVLDIPPEHTLSGPVNLPWHAAYEQYGIYPESSYFEPGKKESHLGFSWPDMDFENYTYIISYGQEICSLSYNVWETVDFPHRTGAKIGHAMLSDQFNPNAVYVYQIKKMRIENDY